MTRARFAALVLLATAPQVGISSPAAPSELQATSPAPLRLVYQDAVGTYWFSSDDGLFEQRSDSVVQHTIESGLCANSFERAAEDQRGNVFFESQDCISRFDGRSFTTLRAVEPESLEQAWSSTPDDVWFRGRWDENGPYRWDGNRLLHLRFPTHPLDDGTLAKANFSPYGVYSIYRDRSGAIWFGTSNLGAARWDGRTLRWLSPESLTELGDGPAPGVRSIVEDRAGYFHFANSLAAYELLYESTESEGDEIDFTAVGGIGAAATSQERRFDSYLAAAWDTEGALWIVTYEDGVWTWDGSRLRRHSLSVDGREPSLRSVYVDREGTVWVVSKQDGLFTGSTGSTDSTSVFEPFRIDELRLSDPQLRTH